MTTEKCQMTNGILFPFTINLLDTVLRPADPKIVGALYRPTARGVRHHTAADDSLKGMASIGHI